MEIVVTDDSKKQVLEVQTKSYLLVWETNGAFEVKGQISPQLLLPLLGPLLTNLMSKWGKS